MDSQTSMLELQTQLWKARAQAKQKRLERSLAKAANGPDEEAWRTAWITRALRTVRRGQDQLKYQAALMDAYAQHLSVLEMTLLGAREQKPAATQDQKHRRRPETQQA